jgi:hypothetical protein
MAKISLVAEARRVAEFAAQSAVECHLCWADMRWGYYPRTRKIPGFPDIPDAQDLVDLESWASQKRLAVSTATLTAYLAVAIATQLKGHPDFDKAEASSILQEFGEPDVSFPQCLVQAPGQGALLTGMRWWVIGEDLFGKAAEIDAIHGSDSERALRLVHHARSHAWWQTLSFMRDAAQGALFEMQRDNPKPVKLRRSRWRWRWRKPAKPSLLVKAAGDAARCYALWGKETDVLPQDAWMFLKFAEGAARGWAAISAATLAVHAIAVAAKEIDVLPQYPESEARDAWLALGRCGQPFPTFAAASRLADDRVERILLPSSITQYFAATNWLTVGESLPAGPAKQYAFHEATDQLGMTAYQAVGDVTRSARKK